jgi:hypothetical protein
LIFVIIFYWRILRLISNIFQLKKDGRVAPREEAVRVALKNHKPIVPKKPEIIQMRDRLRPL